MKYDGTTYTLNKAETKKVETACKKVLKNANRDGGTLYGKLSLGTFTMDGKTCVCDGIRFYRLSCDVHDVPRMTDLPEGYKRTDALDRARAACKCAEPILREDTRAEAMTLPALDDVKDAAKNRPNVPFLFDGIYINPKYLLEVMTAFPGVYFRRPAKQTAPLYFNSAAGDGFIMPVRPPQTDAAA